MLLSTTYWVFVWVHYYTQLESSKKFVTHLKCSDRPFHIILVSSRQKDLLCLEDERTQLGIFQKSKFLFPPPAMNTMLLASSIFFILSSFFFLSPFFFFFVVYESCVSKSWDMEYRHWPKQKLAHQRKQTRDC